MSVALYLDKTSAEIETLLMSFHIEGVEYKFLNPVIGPKGNLEEADYYLATNYKVTSEIMAQSPKLRLVARTGVGFDNVDIGYAKSKNIPVTIARGGNAVSVAELSVAFMLNLMRKICLLDKTTKEGKWQSWDYRHESYDLYEKKVGIIGAGQIGREVAKRVNAFGAECIYYDMFRISEDVEREYHLTYMDLDELLAQADIITIHIPCNKDTIGFFGKEQFRKMKSNAVIINTARAPIINEEELIWALKNKEIAGAALDVFSSTPIQPDNELLTFKNVITTPHIGGATIDAYSRIFSMCVTNIEAVENGKKPFFIVNE